MPETRQPPLAARRDTVCPFDPAAELRELSSRRAVGRMEVQGTPVWLVTGYHPVRALLSDHELFSSRSDAANRPVLAGHMPGDLLAYDPPEHTRLRRLLTGEFTVKRVSQWVPFIEKAVQEHLDAMERAGAPSDLVQDYALPIPSLVISELLGVPYTERARFQEDTRVIADMSVSVEQRNAATAEILAYMGELVTRRRADPDEGLLSTLIRKHGADLNDDELTGIGFLLLVAGHETTANSIALGTALLLQHPQQLALIRDSEEPEVMGRAVEEILRYLSIVHFGIPRRVTRDTEINSQPMKKGDFVAFSLISANRDADLVADDPDRFDITRPPTPHVTFGYGIHQCLGQQLARAEMRVALPALLRRFPELRLTVPLQQIQFKSQNIVYGAASLPVTW